MSPQNVAAEKQKPSGGRRKKKISPSKGLENDTIVKRRDESEACSAQYQHNTVGRKAPIGSRCSYGDR